MNYLSAIGGGLRWCVSCRGRATRKEFWPLFLAFVVVSLSATGWEFAPLMAVYVLMMVPVVAVGVRRLHDRGRAGGWMWLILFPIGGIALLVVLSGRGQPHVNRYGPPPDGVGDTEDLVGNRRTG